MKTMLLLLSLVASAAAEPTALTDTSGRTIQVEILSVSRDSVRIWKKDGEIVAIPLATLDRATRESLDKLRPRGVIVTARATKRVAGKYRYFFDIRNHDDTPWEGEVRVTLTNAMPGVTNGTETFRSQQPIDPGLGTCVWMDAHTGPPSVHSESAVVGFSYIVTSAGKATAPAAGKIIDKIAE